ncbi:MAG: hypothetical protein J7K72_03390 [Candidatus Aenigmarchaeota archaeon]|nr:hypothetical protein [Candidatus Aenigmarchaeota archaeon]
MIEIDWIIGMFVFFVFIAWAFIYYSGMFQPDVDYLDEMADVVQEAVVNNISVDVFSVPVVFNSPADVQDAVLVAEYVWYNGEKNSTKVYENGQTLPCRIVGDKLYWQTNLSQGINRFTIEFANVNVTLNCNSSFSVEHSNMTVPWVLEKNEMVSLNKIYHMTNTSYSKFKEIAGLKNDFMFNIVSPSVNITYGKQIPRGMIDINVDTRRFVIWELAEPANITIAVW